MNRFGRYSQRRVGFGGRGLMARINPAIFAKLVFFGLIGGTILMMAAFFWYSKDLPDPNSIQRKEGFSTQILDRTGKTVLFDVYEDENRSFTPLSEIPESLRQATIAIEDKDFYDHSGFSLIGIARGF